MKYCSVALYEYFFSTKIQLKVTIDPNEGSATFDFTGTGYEVWGNCNAPRAITVSAIIYCLRCLVGQDIPLNQVKSEDSKMLS
jgi:5-oxoprolinase (ATP-hydrolysing)